MGKREPDCWVNVYDAPVFSKRGYSEIGGDAETAEKSDHFAHGLGRRRLYRLRVYLKPSSPYTGS